MTEALLFAQQFEVASVKPAAAGGAGVGRGSIKKGEFSGGPGSADPGRLTITHYSLKRIIMRAWNVEDYRIQTPEWMSAEYFDIVATVPPGAKAEEMNAMLRNLLLARFQMKVHFQPTKGAVFYLVAGAGANKMKPGTESAAVFGGQPKMGPRGEDGFPQVDDAYVRGLGATTTMIAGHAKTWALGETMDRFAQHLALYLQRPVVNQTGLSGAYDFTLLWTPTEGPDVEDPANGAGMAVTAGPPLPAAIEKQLGLRLEKRTEAVDVLVIDRAERQPVEN
jgi:uncharacterized protein (TIGR03435 family)